MLTEQEQEALKAKYGTVIELRAGEDSVWVRGPSRVEFDRWKRDVTDEKRRSNAVENLLLNCIVHPGIEDVQRLFDRRPGLAISFGNECLAIAGLVQDVEKKEL